MQTIFIVAAVAIGVAVIVFMSAMSSSLQANCIKRVLTSQPHIQLIPPDEVARPLRPPAPGRIVAAIVQRPVQRIRSIDQWQKITAELAGWPEITAVTPTMSGSALALRGAELFLVPAAFTHFTGAAHWEVLLRGVDEVLPVSRRQQYIVREIGRDASA